MTIAKAFVSKENATPVPTAATTRRLSRTQWAGATGHTSAGITERIYTHAFNRDEREQRVREATIAAALRAGGAS